MLDVASRLSISSKTHFQQLIYTGHLEFFLWGFVYIIFFFHSSLPPSSLPSYFLQEQICISIIIYFSFWVIRMYCKYFCQLELELPVKSFLFPNNLCPYVGYHNFAGIGTFFLLHWLNIPPLVPPLSVCHLCQEPTRSRIFIMWVLCHLMDFQKVLVKYITTFCTHYILLFLFLLLVKYAMCLEWGVEVVSFIYHQTRLFYIHWNKCQTFAKTNLICLLY